ncbi:hypothetical protein [Enterobacter cloacae]|uniref:hypothetical protein n=1 Tax=Enterobacter cloacae TaxID=550 RepID=UPI002B21F08E|nr:hypothetical protein [Enterobacter cloacae]MEA5217587.1 hypothetical protein [Enterobacter cloacae]
MHLQTIDSFSSLDSSASAESEMAYWLSREKSVLIAPVEIDVNKFHDAAGMHPPMINWSCNTAQDTETFMQAEMICINVTDIFVRVGKRYFRVRDYSNLNHADIVAKVKAAFSPESQSPK